MQINLNMTNVVYSVNHLPIRLTDERWRHIVANHNDLASYYFEVLETVANPEFIFAGDAGELWAVQHFSHRKMLLVIYREFAAQNDGFIITAFFTSKIKKLFQRRILWQRQP